MSATKKVTINRRLSTLGTPSELGWRLSSVKITSDMPESQSAPIRGRSRRRIGRRKSSDFITTAYLGASLCGTTRKHPPHERTSKQAGRQAAEQPNVMGHRQLHPKPTYTSTIEHSYAVSHRGLRISADFRRSFVAATREESEVE